MLLGDLAIVLAIKNGASTVGACLDSIQGAISEGASLYVYDAKSTDGSSEIIFSKIEPVLYSCQEDGGLYFAWNKALLDVKERYIFFLNCDDELCSLENLVAAVYELRCAPDAVAAGGKTLMLRADGKLSFRGRRLSRNWFIGEMPVVTPATVFLVSALRSIRGFDTQYKISSDYDMLSRLLLRFGRSNFIFLPLPIVRFSLNGMSNTRRTLALREVRRIVVERHGLAFGLAHVALEGISFLKRSILYMFFLYKR
jgi:glycosyltransferase involved in cell wall biosynthesis